MNITFDTTNTAEVQQVLGIIAQLYPQFISKGEPVAAAPAAPAPAPAIPLTADAGPPLVGFPAGSKLTPRPVGAPLTVTAPDGTVIAAAVYRNEDGSECFVPAPTTAS